MHNCFSVRPSDPRQKRSGVTLVEILIVTVVIALMAAVSFPVYKIIQQREKEKRLRKILNDVRSAIAGSKSLLSDADFSEGYRTFVRKYGLSLIPNNKRAYFLQRIAQDGYGFPGTIASLSNPPFEFDVPVSDVAGDVVTIKVDRKFIRNIPPHPFTGWNPAATWTYEIQGVGIKNIRSKGAGLALNGRKTDDW
ncbi:MAG: hypothetical protein A2W80_14785 [Candidatus Riflebacteria bacterium GWC2_50_8]|nr:MAG: hypothetical protein A2W80_14785 [Candidatus Riflebacteria bacterium GWC2_50_8]